MTDTVQENTEGITDAQHVANQGAKCPYCGADDTVGHEITTSDGKAEQEMSCNACDRSWIDEYSLSGYRPN
ncbi:MAG TPA: hypothetical protein VEC35_10985 [Noviherbaspirillum sp.]|nr:hypothetical protein [Noviherbaspirillum sp.]